MAPVVEKVQHDPHCCCSFTGLTLPFYLQSIGAMFLTFGASTWTVLSEEELSEESLSKPGVS